MPAAHRHTDVCTGHGCFPSRPNATASSNVFANNLGAHREGDSWKVHCCLVCHSSVLQSGSPNVYVNNKQWGRIGDPVACGSKCKTGSSNVFING